MSKESELAELKRFIDWDNTMSSEEFEDWVRDFIRDTVATK